MRARLLACWLRRGGAVLIAACVTSWLLPLPPWGRGLWNLAVFAGAVHLLVAYRAARKRDQGGGRDA
ncbi:hypothetical protein ACGFWD_33955 [Streptomyces sp. NPDC048448]|uniref:hypothetical protein n=1 Tax=Streptomyces sp. NPDC048448 TaxID=3365554 RepID=UPI00371F9529